jgi:nitroreductase
MTLIRERRSIRKFKKRKIPFQMIEELAEAALRSPSSRGFNPWDFILVSNPEMLDSLSRAKPHGASFLKGAPLGIVVCADSQKSDVWVEDAAIAALYLHLTATALGLGSCWIQIRKRMYDEKLTSEEYIRDLLAIPVHLRVLAILAVGFPDEKKAPHGADYPQYDKIHSGRYATPWKSV